MIGKKEKLDVQTIRAELAGTHNLEALEDPENHITHGVVIVLTHLYKNGGEAGFSDIAKLNGFVQADGLDRLLNGLVRGKVLKCTKGRPYTAGETTVSGRTYSFTRQGEQLAYHMHQYVETMKDSKRVSTHAPN
jgi:hypothetical protein